MTATPTVQYDDPIDVLGLPARHYNILRNGRIHTVSALIECTEEDITDLRNAGMRTLEEIKAKLAEHGLALRPGQTAAARDARHSRGIMAAQGALAHLVRGEANTAVELLPLLPDDALPALVKSASQLAALLAVTALDRGVKLEPPFDQIPREALAKELPTTA